jgi:hypothetical protein
MGDETRGGDIGSCLCPSVSLVGPGCPETGRAEIKARWEGNEMDLPDGDAVESVATAVHLYSLECEDGRW